MDAFTPVSALTGGALIGAAAALLFWFNGRIAGITGIVGELMVRGRADWAWRLAFLAGMLTGAWVLLASSPEVFGTNAGRGPLGVVVAGLLVGFGTRMGNGCTSGHGVCGIPRGSARSIVATITFMATGMLTVAALGALGAG